MRKSNWNTYSTVCFSYNVAQDPRSTGGVHLHQVRRAKSGWQKRILQSNGRFSDSGPVTEVDPDEGVLLYERAKNA